MGGPQRIGYMKSSKKLIEVALPLEAINIASAREKSIRHGHPSTLHLWWAPDKEQEEGKRSRWGWIRTGTWVPGVKKIIGINGVTCSRTAWLENLRPWSVSLGRDPL
jgi:hypothetical protein